MRELLNDPDGFMKHISRVLFERYLQDPFFSIHISNLTTPSSVLLLLGSCDHGQSPSEPCLILNKRSQKVRQPGDICCPGGGISPVPDSVIAKLLTLPFSPLGSWRYWRQMRDQYPEGAGQLALLLATGIREGFEEMRLNPFGIRFLGILPHQPLQSFRREIWPIVARVPRQHHFFPNWEVEKIVRIPVRDLLASENYACYRLEITPEVRKHFRHRQKEFPCFVFQDRQGKELLWGATYRIIMVFLDMVLGFKPPDLSYLPVIHGTLEAHYMTGG
ncbi:CoA pyrophosphatase [Desulfococcaceae bacterium HSG8]|nr:CoA pyrophosphatase [Desulfococcaceae bacterium HSG8]